MKLASLLGETHTYDGVLDAPSFKTLRYTASDVVDDKTLEIFFQEFKKAYDCYHIPINHDAQILVKAVMDGKKIRVFNQISNNMFHDLIDMYSYATIWFRYEGLRPFSNVLIFIEP